MPAPATRPRFQPRLKPAGRRRCRARRCRTASRWTSSASSSLSSASSPTWRIGATRWARGRRELVQDRDRGLPAAHEQRLVLPERGGRLEAEDAALELVGLLDVLEPPGRPQGLRHAVVSTTATVCPEGRDAVDSLAQWQATSSSSVEPRSWCSSRASSRSSSSGTSGRRSASVPPPSSSAVDFFFAWYVDRKEKEKRAGIEDLPRI